MNWQDINERKLTVFSAPWCSDCARFKKILDRNGISYGEVDVDADQKAREYMVGKAGEFSIPQLEVDGKAMVRAWHSEVPGSWSEPLFFGELEEALSSS